MKFLTRTLAVAGLCVAMLAGAQDLVILHTNDTHSHIDADKGVGGILQRKVLIDSVRAAEPNVLLLDAGDAVQGSLYFTLFGGKVEYKLMEMLGYDAQILGNHELDNGIDSLAQYYRKDGVAKLSANYDFSNTALRGVFSPYIIREVGKKKVGIMGLNLDPNGIVSDANYRGLKYNDIISTANATAAKLRSLGCSTVIAVTHIGYSSDSEAPTVTDVDLARASKGIDIIISAHSHEEVSPQTPERPNLIRNAQGKPVLIEQTGRYGHKLGYIKLNLDGKSPKVVEARLIPVVHQDSSKFSREIINFLRPYAHYVDSVNARQIAISDVNMLNTKSYASSTLLSNFTADAVYSYATHCADSLGIKGGIDLALINCGGIRLPMDKGAVTEGQVLSTYPFINYVEIVEADGSLLREMLTQAALQKGQAVSAGVWIGTNADGSAVESILINGRPIDPLGTYRIATLDYLAGGGDYLSVFKKARRLWLDPQLLCRPMMQCIVNMGRAGIPINPDPRPRIVPVQHF